MNRELFRELEKYVPSEHLADYREFVAYQAKHSPTDEIVMICQAAGWFSLIARSTPERLAAALAETKTAIATLQLVSDKAQNANVAALAAVERIENARALLQNSEALGAAIADARKTIGIVRWQFFGWLGGAALVVAVALGLSLGYYWNQQFKQNVLASLQQSEQLNKALIESGRALQFLRDENGTAYILVPKADDAYIGKNGQGVIKFK